jgi:hypothetical protein
MRHRRSRLHRWTAGILALCLTTEACGAGWHKPPGGPPSPLPVRQQVQVWVAGSAQQWHAVSITPDSVTGIPYFRSVSCDSCRLGVPASRVDSIRLGNPVAGVGKTIGLIVGIPVVALIYACRGGRCELR